MLESPQHRVLTAASAAATDACRARSLATPASPASDPTDESADDALSKELEEAAEKIVSEFEQGMADVMDNLEKAQLAFDDLSGALARASWRGVFRMVHGGVCWQQQP